MKEIERENLKNVPEWLIFRNFASLKKLFLKNIS